MLKFFRRIRQKFLSENRFSKYLLYAIGEIILVVIGILIALQINNWNSENLRQKEEIKILKELRIGFESDLKDMRFNQRSYQRAIQASKVLKEVIENDQIYHDSLQGYFGKSVSIPRFIANTGAFETLKSKGVDLISNDSIRLQILEVHDFIYESLKIWEKGAFLDNNFILESYVKHFNHVALWGPIESSGWAKKMTPHDFEKLKQDKAFYSIFITNAIQKDRLNQEISPTIEKLRILIDNIQKEIERLEA